MRKYLVIILLFLAFFQNNLFAQDCIDYLTVDFDHLYHSTCNESVGAVKITIETAPLNSTYYSSTAKTSLNVSYSYTTSITCGIHTYSGTGTINVNNTAPGEHSATFFDDNCMFYFNYTYRPRNPSDISFRLNNSATQETIFNENDTIVIIGGSSNADTYLWDVTNFNSFTCDGSSEPPPLDKAFETCQKDAFVLEGLNVSQKQPITFTVDAHTNNLYSCGTNANSIWVYPRRPKITDIQVTSPSCNGRGDGKIYINSIEGALGTGAGEGSVIGYKITVARFNGTDYDPLSINEDNDVERYITEIPIQGIVLYKDMFFGEEPLLAGKYLIMVENSYQVDDSTIFSNGHTFTEVIIYEKPILEDVIEDVQVNCNGDLASITISPTGGNPHYEIDLYNDAGTVTKSATLNIEPYTYTFSDLPVDTYSIQVRDTNNCNINGTDTNIINNITISQPPILTANISGIDSVLCKGANTGKISLSATGGNSDKDSNFQYSILKDGELFIKDKNITENSSLLIDTLPFGTYTLELQDLYTCDVTFNSPSGTNSFNITEPTNKLEISDTTFSNYNNFEIDCHGSETGVVTLFATGGNGGYYYSHENSTTFDSDVSNIFNNLPKGEHKFYITDASYDITQTNHCLDSVTVTLTEPDTLIINDVTLNDYNTFNIRCAGFQDSVSVNAIGGVADYEYGLGNNSWQSPETIKVFYGLNGKKEIWVKDANNCEDSTTITLTQPETLPAIDSICTIKYNTFDVPCFGDTTGHITIHVNDTTGTTIDGTYSYSLDSETEFQADSIFLNYPAGTFHLRVQDANGCLSNSLSDVITITEPQLLSVTATDTIKYGTFEIKCKGDSNGGFTLNGTGGTESLPTPYTFFLEGNETNNTVTDKPAGTYSYYVKDLNDCISETSSVNLIEPDEITFTFDTTSSYIGNHAIRCFGMTDSVNITPFGGYGANLGGFYNVELNSTSGLVNPGETSKYFDIVANTDYSLNITDGNGCILNSLNVFSVTQPNEMLVQDFSTDSTLCSNSTDGNLNIRWSGGSNNYNYYLKNNTTSEFIDTLYNNNTSNISIFEGLGEATYSVIAEDENNCIETSTTILVDAPDPLLGTKETTNPDCYGDSFGILTISNATGGTTNNPNFYDFYIKTSYGDSIFIPDTEQATFEDVGLGTHEYFIIDDNDCISDAETFEITEPDEMTISTTTQNVSAQGGSNGSAIANPLGGTGTYPHYKWRNSNDEIIAEDVSFIENMPADDYSVEVWDDNGCPDGFSTTGLIDSITIYEPGQALELYVEQLHNVSTPGGADGSVTLAANGGWGQYNYKNGENGIYSAVPEFNGLEAGDYRFYVIDEYDTEVYLNTVITEAEELQIQATSEYISCFGGNDGTITINATGGTEPYTFSTDGVNYLETNTFDGFSIGTYTAYVKDYYNIISSENISVLEPEELTVNITDVQNTTCGQSDGSATADVNGGTTPYIYDWYLNEEHIGQYDATAENLEAGLYTVIITDANSCTASAQETVYNSNGPEIESIITTDASCYNTAEGSATILNITASGSYTIEWNTGQIDVMSINNLEPGNYSVEVNDENDCSVTEAFIIESPAELSFSFNTNSPTCFDACNGSITANLSGGTTPYILEWQNINGNPTTNYVGSLCADAYILNVTDAHNCSYSGTANLDNPEQILILDENQATLCQGQSITLDAGNSGSTYVWTFDNNFLSNEQTVTINEAGNYNITVYSPIGCVAQDEFTLNFSDNFLQANFLMQSEAEIADTVVLVEISWEAPDSVSWDIPSELWILTQSEENIQLVPTQNGIHTVGLTAYLGTCSDYIEKQITITGSPNKGIQTKPEYTSDEVMQFKSVNLYPNPNNGNFTLDISLYEKDDVQIEVYDILGQMQQAHKIGKDEKNYTFEFNINNLNNGLYFISIKTNKGTAGIKFMKQ